MLESGDTTVRKQINLLARWSSYFSGERKTIDKDKLVEIVHWMEVSVGDRVKEGKAHRQYQESMQFSVEWSGWPLWEPCEGGREDMKEAGRISEAKAFYVEKLQMQSP